MMVLQYLFWTLNLFLVVRVDASSGGTHGTPAPADVEDVSLVLVGMRHGNRNPDSFMKTDPNKGEWGHEGSLQLTNWGKNQAYGLGQAVRKRYSDLLPEQFSHKELKATSSSAERCQMTMQTFLAGLYPPVGKSVWKDELSWQPIPVAINNPMLRMYAVDDCKGSDDAWKPIDDSTLPELQEWLARDREVIAYVTGSEGVEAKLGNMADIADNLINLKILGLKYPDWLESPTLKGYDKESLYDKIMTFAEANQIACAKYGPCRKMMGGYWADRIVDTLKKKRDGKSEKLKIVPYASHTEVTLCIMKLMGMDYNAVETSAGFILEYRDQPSKQVRLLFHEADTEDAKKRHIFQAEMTDEAVCKEGEWCDLETFLNGLEAVSVKDWETECEIPGKTCPAHDSASSSGSSSGSGSGSGSGGSGTFRHPACSERDQQPWDSCDAWKKVGYCEHNTGVKYLFCRNTCLCKE